MSTTDIEKRLSAIETELARMKSERVAVAASHPIAVLKRIHGTFEDDEAFQTATRLGRQWRVRQRPSARKAKVKRR